ncbi:(2Fe-2S)-binding protein [Jeotgalibacillus marinus]|uniref:(2Fe-2S)-binding protein n=1 Tax=Jeotgalibacillus marinus TaxID=86667 RepID=A0ABV3Q5N1_9BACL
MKDFIICRCESVCLSDIKKSIYEGATSIPGVKKRTRASMGPCQGRVCQQIIRDILVSEIGQSAKSSFQRSQSPVRPTLLKDI